ncbi:Ribosomal protein S3 [Nostoc sphaeroides CCNUC1]|uniref:Ribosomal protein S3 n=1 Tax=Nostoc sphaeroides CCNUC1 TaxID=2653204 RepID=A0A5P8W6G7_9NOSO|nr:Ribosomal protein S3 [Nostoc sphaeroides CCNUC1]
MLHLWDSLLFEVLRKSAHQILHQNSLSEEIDSCATRVTDEFIQEFRDGVQGVSNYIKVTPKNKLFHIQVVDC